MNKNRRLEFTVGSFVLLGMIAILFLVFKVANLSSITSSNSYSVKARFDNIGSLKVRAPVKVGGVVIGKVTNITLDTERYIPIVTMAIGEEFGEYPAQSSEAQVLTSGLIGEQYIAIKPGFSFDDDTEMLKEGDYFQATKSAIVLEDLIGQFIYGAKE